MDYFENRILLKPVLGGGGGGGGRDAHCITGHEQNNLNRVCYCFHWCIPFSKRLLPFHVEAILSLPVHHYSADDIFRSFGIIGFILIYFEYRILLKQVLKDIASILHCWSLQYSIKPSLLFFLFFGIFLASKGSYNSKL